MLHPIRRSCSNTDVANPAATAAEGPYKTRHGALDAHSGLSTGRVGDAPLLEGGATRCHLRSSEKREKMRQAVALLLLAAACAGEAITESGYLLTAPKVFQAGTSERACLTLHNLPGPGRKVRLTFFQPDIPEDQLSVLDESDFLLFQTQAEIPDSVAGSGEYCFDIAIPATVTGTLADVKMTLSSPQFSFSEKNKVSIKSEAMITLVQTDKAKYQPGQKVLFRILTLRHDLTSLNDNLEEVWITTPQRTRLAQWRDVEANTGMVQLELQLTEETPLGRWTIHVKTPQGVIRKSFSVEEYVLPTFEVTIEAPDRIEDFARTITAKVCAKYTFGKPLINANVTINATADISDYYYRNEDNELKRNISDYFATDEEGCAIFDLLVGKLGIGNSRYGSYHTVDLNVEVEEEGTGLKQAESKKISQSSSSISLREAGGSQERFFKPGLPFYGQYELKQNDDKPAVKEIVKVCHTATYKDKATSLKKPPTPDDFLYRANEKYEGQVESTFGYEPLLWETEKAPTRTTRRDCREYETNEKGIIYYYIPAQAEDVDSLSVDISANTDLGSDSSYNTYRAFFSPSGSYISIDTHQLPDVLPCSGDLSVNILTSLRPNVTAPESMVYKILSRGKIIKVGQTGVDLTFPVLPKMAPEFKLLVYYVLDSGEVVSDSRVMKVAKCFPNQVQVNWDQETVRPGDSASFTIRAAPNSVCGVTAVDRSVELLGTENQITMDTVFNQLNDFVIRRYTSPNQLRSDDEYCKDVQIDVVRALQGGGATKDELTPPPKKKDSDGHRISSSRPFSDPTFRTDRDDSLKVFDNAGFMVMSNLGLENRPCYKRVPPVEIPEEILQAQRRPVPISEDVLTADFEIAAAPPAIAQNAAFSGGSGGGNSSPPSQEDQVREDFPEAFLFMVETLNADGVKTLTSEMPDTITSWVGSAICTNDKDGFGLSNKSSITTFKPFFTEVTLPYSLKRGEVLNMSASVFNFLESSLSVYLELGESSSYDLADAASPAGYDLCIAPGRTVVNYFPLTFTDLGEVNITVSVRAKDGNCEEANTVAPGSDTVIRSIVVKPEGFPQVETTSRFICLDKGDDNHVETVELPVRDELVADSERAFFSVIGDLLGPTYRNLESGLIDAPTGGGEPNMITFVPNIYIRAYLEEAGLLTELQKRQTNNNMKNGYQRQLRYRRYDGSFSSYGSEDFQGSVWLTSFVVQAFKEASKYIDIDQDSIRQSVSFVLRNQAPDGCFERVGDLIHKEMRGGVERGGRAALTAFVMLALKDVATSDELAGGFACLEDGLLLPNKTLYSEVLMAYTYLSMGQEVKGKRLVEKLLTKAKREGYDVLYWEGDRSSPIGGSRSVDIEMTSYMVLALLKISGKGYLEDAARAVRWINTQRNDKGGFKSTQDTIVAIRALTAFADRTFSSELTSSVSVTSSGGGSAELSVDPSNRLLLQQQKVPDLELPASLRFEVTPPGCVVLQSTFKYSSKLQVPNPAFSLGIASKPRGRGGSYELEVCTSYLRIPGSADRVILDVELPSGYIPVDSTLRKLRQERVVRKYNFKDGKVTFTLQTVSEDKTCLPFRILQETEVKELKPAVINVYDFYRPEDKNRKEYELAPAA